MVGLMLAEARSSGLSVLSSGGKLIIRGPRSAGELARRLLDAKSDVLALLDFEARLFDAAALREWIPTLAWSDVPPGGTVPHWCEEWEQPDYTSWAHAPCLKLEEESEAESEEEASLPLVLPDGWVQEGAFIVAIDGETKRGGAA